MAAKNEIPTASSIEIPVVDQSKYEILKPDGYHTKIESQEKLLEEYLWRVNNLIQRIVGDEKEPSFDTVVFLDKSARPLAWMVRKFWPHMAPQRINENTGELEVVPQPDMKFINIDRIPWRNDPNLSFDEGGAKEIKPEDVEGLRSIFQTSKKDNILDEKRVLLVDEQAETGDTLQIAQKLFERAFPTSVIQGAAWIHHQSSTNNKGQQIARVKEIPLWYPRVTSASGFQEEFGRGVNNPVEYNPSNPYHNGRVLPGGYQFLSTAPGIKKDRHNLSGEDEELIVELQRKRAINPEERARVNRQIRKLLTEPDRKSIKLREEVSYMLGDFLSGKLFPIITTDRKEVLGQDPIVYGRRARDIRAKR